MTTGKDAKMIRTAWDSMFKRQDDIILRMDKGFNRMHEEIVTLKNDTKEILKEHNGRLINLEAWKSKIVGAMAVITFVMGIGAWKLFF